MDKFRLKKVAPAKYLSDLVNYYLIIEGDSCLKFTFLPDNISVLVFQFSGRVTESNQGKTFCLNHSRFSTSFTTVRKFSTDEKFGVIMVFMKPYGIYKLFGIDNEFKNKSLLVSEIIKFSSVNDIENQIAEQKEFSCKVKIVEEFLFKQFQTEKQIDPRLFDAIDIIHNSYGLIPSAEIAKKIFMSQRTLERKFARVIGLNVKEYSSLIRMKNVLKYFPKTKDYFKIIADYNYYDQSHFIKYFKKYTGLSPKQFSESVFSKNQLVDFLQLYLDTIN